MARRKGHMTKSPLERQQYVKYIKEQDYEPTKEEGLNFNDSSDKDEDYSVGKTNKPRRLSLTEQVKDHLLTHWVGWLIAGVSLILGFYTFSAKFELNTHDIKIEQNKSDIETANKRIEEVEKQNTQQDLQIQENKIRLEYSDKLNADTMKDGK